MSFQFNADVSPKTPEQNGRTLNKSAEEYSALFMKIEKEKFEARQNTIKQSRALHMLHRHIHAPVVFNLNDTLDQMDMSNTNTVQSLVSLSSNNKSKATNK